MKFAQICLISFLLSGCLLIPDEPDVIVKRQPINLPKIDLVTLDPVKWVVVTEENAPSLIAETNKTGEKFAVFGLTPANYENITVNFGKIMMLIKQQKSIIEAYQKYYEQPEEATVTK